MVAERPARRGTGEVENLDRTCDALEVARAAGDDDAGTNLGDDGVNAGDTWRRKVDPRGAEGVIGEGEAGGREGVEEILEGGAERARERNVTGEWVPRARVRVVCEGGTWEVEEEKGFEAAAKGGGGGEAPRGGDFGGWEEVEGMHVRDYGFENVAVEKSGIGT